MSLLINNEMSAKNTINKVNANNIMNKFVSIINVSINSNNNNKLKIKLKYILITFESNFIKQIIFNLNVISIIVYFHI